ncbi:hypothetical protein BU26DRAFT_116006 [Trematosphaeria pertusa]|uniref:SWIM-type domain-containing protein n=1 Tax=Trematosphaeria pertusa TaxID=390896 RepID=A0A6A6I175_9PLEO|nr:uncharacterized protein BU26DRAFT_116006 [Trematosphaeria pertusa]KAF2243330.1 hypothetical protein BU26DRAFT_116006 [Trematosphaeria pertusa]
MASSTLPASREFITQLLDSLRGIAPQHSADTGAESNALSAAPEPAKKQLLTLHVLFPNELLPALDLLDRRLVTRFRIRREPKDTGEEAAPQNATTVSRSPGHKEGTAAQLGANEIARLKEASAHNLTVTRAAGQMHSADATMRGVESFVPYTADMTDVPRSTAEEGRHSSEGGDVAAQQSQSDVVYYVRSAQQKSSRYSTSYDSTTSYEVRLTAWNCSCPAFAFAAFPSVHPEPPTPTYDEAAELSGSKKSTDDAEWIFGAMSLGEGTPPVCKHLLACVLVERCSGLFGEFVEEKEVSVEEAAGWAAGWGD